MSAETNVVHPLQEPVYLLPRHWIEPLTSPVTGEPANPRREYDPQQLEELAASLRQHGLQQAIVVRVAPGSSPPETWTEADRPRIELVAGERRVRASTLAGMERISCTVRELTYEQAYEILLTENFQRVDLGPVEEARGFAGWLELGAGRTQAQLAERLGVSQGRVSQAIGLLRYPDRILAHLERRTLRPSHVHGALFPRLLELPEADAAEAFELVADWIDNRLSAGMPVETSWLRSSVDDLAAQMRARHETLDAFAASGVPVTPAEDASVSRAESGSEDDANPGEAAIGGIIDRAAAARGVELTPTERSTIVEALTDPELVSAQAEREREARAAAGGAMAPPMDRSPAAESTCAGDSAAAFDEEEDDPLDTFTGLMLEFGGSVEEAAGVLAEIDELLTDRPDLAVPARDAEVLSAMREPLSRAMDLLVRIRMGSAAESDASLDGVARCRICGCTEDRACEGGCAWAEDPKEMGDLCDDPACLRAAGYGLDDVPPDGCRVRYQVRDREEEAFVFGRFISAAGLHVARVHHEPSSSRGVLAGMLDVVAPPPPPLSRVAGMREVDAAYRSSTPIKGELDSHYRDAFRDGVRWAELGLPRPNYSPTAAGWDWRTSLEQPAAADVGVDPSVQLSSAVAEDPVASFVAERWGVPASSVQSERMVTRLRELATWMDYKAVCFDYGKRALRKDWAELHATLLSIVASSVTDEATDEAPAPIPDAKTLRKLRRKEATSYQAGRDRLLHQFPIGSPEREAAETYVTGLDEEMSVRRVGWGYRGRETQQDNFLRGVEDFRAGLPQVLPHGRGTEEDAENWVRQFGDPDVLAAGVTWHRSQRAGYRWAAEQADEVREETPVSAVAAAGEGGPDAWVATVEQPRRYSAGPIVSGPLKGRWNVYDHKSEEQFPEGFRTKKEAREEAQRMNAAYYAERAIGDAAAGAAASHATSEVAGSGDADPADPLDQPDPAPPEPISDADPAVQADDPSCAAKEAGRPPELPAAEAEIQVPPPSSEAEQVDALLTHALLSTSATTEEWESLTASGGTDQRVVTAIRASFRERQGEAHRVDGVGSYETHDSADPYIAVTPAATRMRWFVRRAELVTAARRVLAVGEPPAQPASVAAPVPAAPAPRAGDVTERGPHRYFLAADPEHERAIVDRTSGEVVDRGPHLVMYGRCLRLNGLDPATFFASPTQAKPPAGPAGPAAAPPAQPAAPAAPSAELDLWDQGPEAWRPAATPPTVAPAAVTERPAPLADLEQHQIEELLRGALTTRRGAEERWAGRAARGLGASEVLAAVVEEAGTRNHAVRSRVQHAGVYVVERGPSPKVLLYPQVSSATHQLREERLVERVRRIFGIPVAGQTLGGAVPALVEAYRTAVDECDRPLHDGLDNTAAAERVVAAMADLRAAVHREMAFGGAAEDLTDGAVLALVRHLPAAAGAAC